MKKLANSNLPWILDILWRQSLSMHLHSIGLTSGSQLEIRRYYRSIAGHSMLSLIHRLVSLPR